MNLLVIASVLLFGVAAYLRYGASMTPTKASEVLRPIRLGALGMGCSVAALIVALSGTQARLALVTVGVTLAWVGLWAPKRFRRLRVESEMVVQCHVEEAFDLFADPRNEPRYQPIVEYVEQLSPERIGVGSVFRGWVNIPSDSQPGMQLVIEEEITEFFRPQYVATRIVGQKDVSRLAFSPIDGGTRVHAVYDGLIQFEAALLGGVFRRWVARRRILDARRNAWAEAKAILEDDAA